MFKKTILLSFFSIFSMLSFSQTDQLPENDPIIVNRISQWQDLKFGFMMH